MPALISNTPLDTLRRRAWSLCEEAAEILDKPPKKLWADATDGCFRDIQDCCESAASELTTTRFIDAFKNLQQAEQDTLFRRKQGSWE